MLTFTSSRYSVYQLPGKVENSSFLTQICPKNGFRFGISENESQNKNQHPQDLGLKFEKTNIEITINIFEILCVYVCVCANFQAKQTALTFSAQICRKMDLVLAIQKNIVGIRISILDIPCVPIFSQNEQL